MSLPAVCPVCGACAPIEAFLGDAAARSGLAEAIKLWPAPLAAGALGYFALFAAVGKKVPIGKLARVMGEFVALVASGEVTRGRESRPAPHAAWAAGLAEIQKMAEAGTLQRPLASHALLAEIVHRRASAQARQTAAASKPLHPSHRPAVLPGPAAPLDPIHQPAPTRADWAARRDAGVRHVGALLARLGAPEGAGNREQGAGNPEQDAATPTTVTTTESQP